MVRNFESLDAFKIVEISVLYTFLVRIKLDLQMLF